MADSQDYTEPYEDGSTYKPDPDPVSPFRQELIRLLNKHNRESGSDTPDFILANYLIDALLAFDRATRARQEWHGIPHPKHPAVNHDIELSAVIRLELELQDGTRFPLVGGKPWLG